MVTLSLSGKRYGAITKSVRYSREHNALTANVVGAAVLTCAIQSLNEPIISSNRLWLIDKAEKDQCTVFPADPQAYRLTEKYRPTSRSDDVCRSHGELT